MNSRFRLGALVLTLSTLVLSAASAQPAPTPPPPVPLPPYGTSLTLAQAHVVMAVALAEAKRRGVPLTIAVVDAGGALVLAERMDGASLASSETSILKAKSAVYWQRSTSTWLASIAASHGSQTTYPHIYAGVGGEPILVAGRIVGGVGVGGNLANEGEVGKIAAVALQ